MHLPEIIFLVLLEIDLLCAAFLHGKPTRGNHNIFTTILNDSIITGILYWGGFFTN